MKMKAIKKCISVLSVVSLLAITTACSSGKKEGGTSSSQSTATPQAPAKISMFISDHSQPVPSGNVMDDPTFKYLAQKTNTDLSIEFLQHAKYDEQLKIKFASGAMPDIVQGYSLNPDLYANKKLLPLNDLIDKYGPNLKKNITKEAWDNVTVGGKIYGIPESALGNAPAGRIIYVRKDWMDKVGIKEAPKTSDEFLNMLRAFRDKDPNGNGKKDEIPFTSRENLSWSENIMGMFGVTPYGFHIIDGELVPDIINPQMKQAVAFFRTMVEEKLIDSEFLTLKRNVWEQKIQSDLAGSWNHVTDLVWDWQNRLNTSLPGKGAQVIAIPTPVAPGVQFAGMGATPVKKVFNITTSAKNPEAIIKMFDWLASAEGQEFVNFGVPGITYNKDGDKINYDKQKDTDNKSITWRAMLLNLIGYNKELLTVQLGKDAVDKLDETYAIARKEGIPNPVSGMPALKSQLKYPDLGAYGATFVQAASKVMFGEKPIDYFDEYVKTWRTQGGNEIIKEATDWYNANKK